MLAFANVFFFPFSFPFRVWMNPSMTTKQVSAVCLSVCLSVHRSVSILSLDSHFFCLFGCSATVLKGGLSAGCDANSSPSWSDPHAHLMNHIMHGALSCVDASSHGSNSPRPSFINGVTAASNCANPIRTFRTDRCLYNIPTLAWKEESPQTPTWP